MDDLRALLVDEPVEGLAPLVARAVGDTLVELGKRVTHCFVRMMTES